MFSNTTQILQNPVYEFQRRVGPPNCRKKKIKGVGLASRLSTMNATPNTETRARPSEIKVNAEVNATDSQGHSEPNECQGRDAQSTRALKTVI